jgi:hypothetical protein
MTANEYLYALGEGTGLNGKQDSNILFRKRGEVIEVRVNRAIEQVQVLSATSPQISLPGTGLEEYITSLRETSKGLSEVTVASFQESGWAFDEGVEVFDSIEPHLIVTGWSSELTDDHKVALENSIGFF